MRILKTLIIWIFSAVLVNKCIIQAVPTLAFSRDIFSVTPNIVMFICEVSNNASVTIEVYRANDTSRSDQLAMEVDTFSVEYTAVLSPSNEIYVICIEGDNASDPVYFAAIPVPPRMNPEPVEVYVSRDNLFSLQCPYQLGIASNIISPYHYVWFDSNGIEIMNETTQTLKGNVSAGDMSSVTRYSCALRIKECSSDCTPRDYPSPSFRLMFEVIASANCTVPSEPTSGIITARYPDDIVLNHNELSRTVPEGTTLNYRCASGLTLTGPNSIICTKAQWTFDHTDIRCLASCTVPASGQYNENITAFYPDGSVLDYEQLNETVLEGTVLNYHCDTGFSRFENTTCSNGGVWDNNPAGYYCATEISLLTNLYLSLAIIGVIIIWLIPNILCIIMCICVCKKGKQTKRSFVSSNQGNEMAFNTEDTYSSVEDTFYNKFQPLTSNEMSVSLANNDETVEGVSSTIVNAWTVILDEVMKLPELPDALKISKSQLKLKHDPIGQGETGVVYKGVLMNWKGQPARGVAVKTLKGFFSSNDIQFLLKEVIKMKDFDHPHVMPLIGVCLDAGPGVSMVMPYMDNGSLLEYLKKNRDDLKLTVDSSREKTLKVQKLLLRICYQISLGMQYLSQRRFIHRDLAARNCMLDSSCNIKVSDFGLSEDVYSTGYFRQTDRENVRLPFKWMALESLNDAIFTEKTDVWSYGVTMWEIFSGGQIPYPGVDVWSLVKILDRGERLDTPTNAACSAEIFAVMQRCWSGDSEERPTFTELSSIMETLLSSVADYTELSMVLPHLQQNLTDENGYAEILDTTLGVTD